MRLGGGSGEFAFKEARHLEGKIEHRWIIGLPYYDIILYGINRCFASVRFFPTPGQFGYANTCK